MCVIYRVGHKKPYPYIELIIRFQPDIRSKIHSAFWSLNHFSEIDKTFEHTFKIFMQLVSDKWKRPNSTANTMQL